MKYLFAGGGTGGHIFPAIAIADEIRKLDNDADILFIGAKGRIEEKIVPSNNYRLETISITGIDRSNMLKNVSLPLRFANALNRCRKIIKEFKPAVAVGTGGFVCGPVIYQARRAGVPALVQEGNSYAGKTIRFLAPLSDKVVINFEETLKYLKRKDNVIRIGHPIRSSLRRIDKQEALRSFELPENRKTVFVFGGSQGAKGINKIIAELAPELYAKEINLIWQAGTSDGGRTASDFESMKDGIRVMEFIENMDAAYSASDVVICRAGITSIMELAFMRVPSILIPLPGSAENHQEMNARSYEAMGAAKVFLQNEPKIKLMEMLTSLLDNDDMRRQMSDAGERFSDPLAAVKIAQEVISLAGR